VLVFPTVGVWRAASPLHVAGATAGALLVGALAFAVTIHVASSPVRVFWFVSTAALLVLLVAPILAATARAPPGAGLADLPTVVTLLLTSNPFGLDAP
jgi:hypothetical protein